MLQEFKAFIARGNVLDLAVGGDHRRRVRHDRHLAHRRRDHAGDRRGFGGIDFSNYFVLLERADGYRAR